jgi:hypothetical protein
VLGELRGEEPPHDGEVEGEQQGRVEVGEPLRTALAPAGLHVLLVSQGCGGRAAIVVEGKPVGRTAPFDQRGVFEHLVVVVATRGPMLQKERMQPIIRKYASLDEMKADEYRYWQCRPLHERIDAVEEMIQDAYALKGWEIEPDVPRLQRPFVRLPCPWR